MPSLHQKKTPLIQERLINALKALDCAEELTYLIEALKETKINHYAEAAIFLFTLAYCHPSVISDTKHKAMQKLCQDCYQNATPNQLLFMLEKPENRHVKELFDRFILKTIKENKKEAVSVAAFRKK